VQPPLQTLDGRLRPARTVIGVRVPSAPPAWAGCTLADGEATWGDTTVLRGGDVAAEVAAIKDQPGGDLLVEGSARLVHTLAQHGLVDEYRLMVFPVLLGQGKRLFPDSMPAPAKLTLTNSRTVGSGVLLLNLTPDQGAPTG
jgi:dihydrofolate reductase